ncbi:tRNA (adenosine(37)-N6)-dimethylallyltransferase MiaA [Puniceicoccales bacterium CK1056]|uniref:tRNA dimethylallyltransferase n=1 Tax=Oceanipulchritudo coccoides TaxID=2706888 RepID=A0A6B2M379_9BACT|nr:tRNA (adenosine(37)-N6)-dimethylallyltransferase MiaA [Oceanipulchritudo coccoides]NDV62537.1 tRNA (adenosine(37)-N6)-dimethylallyltransferase MiaA [Oceanipulchritudo coccoides]
MSHPRLLFIVGPTASGKTEIALREAERNGASILSCDSLCVFKGMDIGTAKPTPGEQKRVPHYGIDLAEPRDPFSVSKYIEYRDQVLAKHREEKRPIIVAGGSGFYLKSFFAPVIDEIEVPEKVNLHVQGIHQSGGLEGMIEALIDLHEGNREFPGLDLQNPRRVEKALVRCLASGKKYGELLSAFKSQPEPLADWDKEVWLIERDREDLQERNRQRVHQMLRAGLIDEVRRLRAEGFEQNPSASGSIGYREVLEYLDNPGSEEDLAENIYIHTNQLMRKQRTWFRRQIPVTRTLKLT